VSPVKYELGFYIPEDDILHSHRRENLKYASLVLLSAAAVHIARTALQFHLLRSVPTLRARMRNASNATAI
jgi:hypothetical protein